MTHKEQILEQDKFLVSRPLTAVKQVTIASNNITTRKTGPVTHKPVKYLTAYFGTIASLTF